MKIVVNRCYGGFGLTKDACRALGVEYDFDIDRTDSRLIAMVEADAAAIASDYAELQVVEIPAEATDFYINEYDGLETVLYVLNGKICFA